MPRPLKTARHRGILQTSLSLRVRKVAADAPFQRLVSEAYFWRLVFDGWRTISSASWAPFLPRFQLIDDSVISREQSFSRKDESVRQCVQLASRDGRRATCERPSLAARGALECWAIDYL